MFTNRILAAIAISTLASTCWGANVTVTASNYKFTPAVVEINVGDTVTFKNAEGHHNVVADDESYLSGSPSNEKWTFEHTYTSAGTFGYFCAPHGSPGNGMFGTVHVNAVTTTPSIKLGGYLSGNWYNPAQGGHGFQFEFTNQADSAVPTQNELVAIWFVYTPDGSAQNWIYAQGPYDASKNTVTLPATIFHGARFPYPAGNFDSNALQGSLGDWGTLTFTFSDCNNGTASWTSTANGYGNGSIPITRVTSIQGTSCPAP
jgi:plastocyanin